MSQNDQNKQRGSVNYAWVLAGGYLIFTAIKIFKIIIAGQSDAPVAGTIGGIVFVLVGAFLLLREWKAYRYGQAHIDDPTSWSLDDEDDDADNDEAELIAEGDVEEEE
jgi:hypothetical protein